MTTCRDIITYALRMTKVLPAGGSPESSEAVDGLVALQSMYDQWVANGMFGRLEDVRLDDDDTAQEGKRYYLESGVTLTEPTTIPQEDSDTGERQPRDLALYESLTAAGVRTVRLYDRKEWVDLLSLTLDSEAPLASRGAFGLAACLAVSGGFAAMFGNAADIGPDSRRQSALFEGGLSYKLGSTRDKAAAEYF